MKYKKPIQKFLAKKRLISEKSDFALKQSYIHISVRIIFFFYKRTGLLEAEHSVVAYLALT